MKTVIQKNYLMKNKFTLPPTMERILRFSVLKYGLTFLLLSTIYNLQASSITIEDSCIDNPVTVTEGSMTNNKPSYQGTALINGNSQNFNIFWNGSAWIFGAFGAVQYSNSANVALPPSTTPSNANGWIIGVNANSACNMTVPTITVCDIEITTVAITDETCPGNNDGEIVVTATCSTCSSISYSIDDFVTFNSTGTFTGLAPADYTVKVNDASGGSCSAEQLGNVVNTTPNVMFTAPADVCVDAMPLTGLGGGTPPQGMAAGELGVYSGPGVVDDNNGLTYSYEPGTAGVGTHTIRYTYTNANLCTSFAEDDIEVLALPTVTFSSPGQVCLGDMPVLLSGGTPAQGSAMGDMGVYSGLGVTGPTNGDYFFDPATPGVGTHTLTYEYLDDKGCTASATADVEVVSPDVTFEALADLCVDAGLQEDLTGGMPSSTTGDGVYSGPGVTNNNDGTYNFDPDVAGTTGAGTYTIVYTYTDGNSCMASASDDVVVFALPTPTFTALADLCIDAGPQMGLGGGTTVEGTETNDNGVYSGLGVTDNDNGTYDFDPMTAGAGTHTITYTYTDENGCSASAMDDVEVFALPDVMLSDFLGVCVDAGVQTGLGGGSPTTTLTGVYSGDGVTDAGDGLTFSFDPDAAATGVGSHSITYTYTDGNGCTASDAVLIEVFALPVVTFEAPDFCTDESVQELVEGMPAGGEYTGIGVINNNDGTYSFDPSANAVGTYAVTYAYTDQNGCSASVTDDIEVFDLPTVTLEDPGDFCLNDGVQTSLTGGEPVGMAMTGVYSGPGVTNLGNGITYDFNPATAGVGVHTITYEYTDANGCSNTASVNIEVFGLPTVTFTAPTMPICDNDGELTSLMGGTPVQGAVAGDKGEYSGSGVTDNNDGTYDFDPAIAGNGTHPITYTYTDGNGCEVSASDDVVVDEAPDAMLTNPGNFCVNQGPQMGLGGGIPAKGTEVGDNGEYSGSGVTDNNDGTYDFDPGDANGGVIVGMNTIIYTYTAANGCEDVAEVMVEVFSAPGVTFTAPGPFCDNAGVQMDLDGGMPSAANDFGTYTGTGVSDNTDGTFDFDPAEPGAGSVTYEYTDGNGCTASATGTIVIYTTTPASFTAPADLCIDEGLQSLTTGMPAGGEYDGDGVIDNQDGTYDFDPTDAGVGVHTITYTFTDANTCVVSTMDDVEVFDPMVAFSPQAAVCSNAGDQILGGGTPTAAGTGVYSGNGVSDDGNGLTFTFDPADASVVPGANTLTYTYTDANGCVGTANSDITVNTAPVVSFTPPGDQCSNAGLLELTGGTPAQGTATQDMGIYSGNEVIDNGDGTYDFDTDQTPGTYMVTYTYKDANGCEDTETVSIEIFQAPTVTLTNPGNYCVNAGVQSGLGGGTPAEGAVTGDMGMYLGQGVTDDGNGMTYSFDPSTAGVGMHDITYTYTDNNTCSDEATVTVEVFASPVVTFTAPGPQCSNGEEQMFGGGTPSQGASVGDMGLYSGPGVSDDGNGVTYTFDPTMANTPSSQISYTYTDENGCAVTVSDFVDINTAPTVTLNLSDYCIDAGPQTLSGGSPQGSTSVYSGAGVTAVNGTYSFNPATAGVGVHIITYEYTDANGCTNSAMDDVEVFALPIVTFSALDDLCIDAGVQGGLGGGLPTGTATTGIYSGLGVTNTGDGVTYSFDPMIAGAGTHNITYTYTDANGCTNSATDNVDVFALPVVSLTAPADLCIDGGLQPLTGIPSQGTATGDIGVFSGDGVIDNGDGTYDFDPEDAEGGIHTITYTYTDANGCTNSAMDDVEVFAPEAALTTPAPICENAVVVTLGGGTPIQGTVAGDMGLYSGTGVTDNGNGLSYDFDPASGPGTYVVTYTYTDENGCLDAATANIVVNAAPAVMFTAPADLCFDDIVLTGLSGGLPAQGTVAGDMGVYSGTGVTDDGNGMTYSFDPASVSPGTYTITYTYTNENGCIDSASGDITVNPENTVTAPSSSPTLCINSPLTDITHTTTGATGIDPAIDLPMGVMASFDAGTNTITISGTPAEAGTFNYDIPLTGGCGMVSATGTITVEADNTPPTITCPVDVAVNNTPGTCGADAMNITLGSPIVMDNCNMNIVPSNDAPANFPVGTTMVTWTADDGNGNTATCQQMVTVIDNEGPTPVVTPLLDVEAQCIVSSLTAPTATDNCTANTVTVTNNATLPITAQGETVVTWTFDDGVGNTSIQTQLVVIEDTMAPVVTAPADITVEVSNGCSAENFVLGSATITDNCQTGLIAVNDADPSYPIGTFDITWTADDGNQTGTDVQTITVIASDINVQGNGTDIASGDMTPDTADDTDFGSITVGGMTTRTFTIQNLGDATLDLTANMIVAISGSSNFTVMTQPSATTIISGDSGLTFQVTYSSSAAGTDDATISIASNDCDTPTYTFDITGSTVVACDININSITTTDEICPGADDGTLTVDATCTTCTSIEYSIDGFITFNTNGEFTNLADGTYTIDVRDAGAPMSCTATDNSGTVINPGVVVLNVPTTPNGTALFKASQTVNSDATVQLGQGTTNITFEAGNDINLLQGFEVELGAHFEANIVECPQ